MDYLTQVFSLRPQTSATTRGRNSRNRSLANRIGSEQFGSFKLTRAIRPSTKSPIKPQSGYRYDKYVDEAMRTEIPVIMASASSEKLFPLFIHLCQQLGETVDVVLETSHDHESSGHLDLFREQIEMPILTSNLWEFEDLLLNDGCTGIAVLNPHTPQEVQFDEHKLLIMYGHPLESFERILEEHEIPYNPTIKFITEGEHIHASNELFVNQFQQLTTVLGTEIERE